MEKDHRGFTHQTIQETSPWVEEEKRNNNCVHSEGLRFAIKNGRTEGEIISEGFLTLFKETTSPYHLIRSIGISFGNVVDDRYESFTLFTDYEALEKEKQLQETLVDIKGKYGKNAILKGMNLQDKATTRKRNTLIGGHNAK